MKVYFVQTFLSTDKYIFILVFFLLFLGLNIISFALK